jgi:alkylation response protein AidB-like acyl-CoA dehydrogenase
MVRRAVSDFVKKEINPYVDQWEQQDGFVPLKPLFKKMGKLGFLGIRYDPKYGGQGFIYQMRQFQHERFSLLPFTCIAAKDIIDLTVEHIKTRVVFGKPLITKQVLRHRLVEWLTEIEGLKHLIDHIVRMKEAGLDATREISMGKLMAGQVLNKVADGCLQMFGGNCQNRRCHRTVNL